MYESPITIKTEEIARNIMDKQEEYILTQVQMCVDVDKDELLKALQYDRNQYEKGYADGRANATKHGRWIDDWDIGCSVCSECDDSFLWEDFNGVREFNYCPTCGCKMDEVADEID